MAFFRLIALVFVTNLLHVSRGALLLCADGDGDQWLRGLTVDGAIFDFSLNLENDFEWAGATFAVADPRWNDVKIRGNNKPLGGRSDRVTLFVNRQGATSGPTPPAGARRARTARRAFQNRTFTVIETRRGIEYCVGENVPSCATR